MPVAEVVSLIPISEILKMVISQAKKVKDFKPLFEDLASTMERLVPFLQEIDLLQERLDPGNGELNFLNKTMLRAEKMARKCSRVRVYSLAKKNSYTAEIKRINEDFVKFCQLDLSLIQHRNHLRSLSLKMEESPPRPEETSNISTRASLEEDEQRVLWESFEDKGKGKQVKVDEQVAAALQESLKELSLREAEELAIQESVFLGQREEQAAKRRARELQKDEQIANGLLYDERGLTNGSSSSTRALLDEDEQRILWESLKDKGKGNQVKADEQVAAALQESLNMEKLSLREAEKLAIQESMFLRQREEQVAKRRARELQKDEQIANGLLCDEKDRISNVSSSSTRADEQRIIWESLKDKGKGKHRP